MLVALVGVAVTPVVAVVTVAVANGAGACRNYNYHSFR